MENETELLERMEQAVKTTGWAETTFCGRAGVGMYTMNRLRRGGSVTLATIRKINKLIEVLEADDDAAE